MSAEDFDKKLAEFYAPQIKKLLEQRPNIRRMLGNPEEAKPLTWRQEFRFWIFNRRYWLAEKLRTIVYWLEGTSPYGDDE